MSFSQIADFADLIAALGVIGSMLFLAIETRKNANQTRIANHQTSLAGLKEHKRRTDSLDLADILVRGRVSYLGLSEPEKLAFTGWMEEMIQSYDTLIAPNVDLAVSKAEARRAAVGAFAFHFGFPGCREWWHASGLADRWPRHIVQTVQEGLVQAGEEQK